MRTLRGVFVVRTIRSERGTKVTSGTDLSTWWPICDITVAFDLLYVQYTHVQYTHVQYTHVQYTHVQYTHVQYTHVQYTHVTILSVPGRLGIMFVAITALVNRSPGACSARLQVAPHIGPMENIYLAHCLERLGKTFVSEHACSLVHNFLPRCCKTFHQVMLIIRGGFEAHKFATKSHPIRNPSAYMTCVQPTRFVCMSQPNGTVS
jgi:hypothetical protein